VARGVVLVKVWQLFLVRCAVIVGCVAVLGTFEGLLGGGPR
jgi:hypothetical protein